MSGMVTRTLGTHIVGFYKLEGQSCDRVNS